MADNLAYIRKRYEGCPVPDGSSVVINYGPDTLTIFHPDLKCRTEINWLEVGPATYNLIYALHLACAYKPDVGRLLERIEELEKSVELMK